MRDGRRERHRAPWHATCRGQRVSPLSPARPAAAQAGGAATSRGTHRRCAPRGDIRRLKNNDAATSITRGQVLALRIKLDRADQVLCAGGARRRVVTGPCSPCAAPPLASAQASHPAPLWHPLRPTSRLIMAIRGCGAPSAGSSVESFSPKTCLNRQFAFAIDGAACTAKHRCQSAWPPEHITGGNARGIPRAIGRGSPLLTAPAPEICLPRRGCKVQRRACKFCVVTLSGRQHAEHSAGPPLPSVGWLPPTPRAQPAATSWHRSECGAAAADLSWARWARASPTCTTESLAEASIRW